MAMTHAPFGKAVAKGLGWDPAAAPSTMDWERYGARCAELVGEAAGGAVDFPDPRAYAAPTGAAPAAVQSRQAAAPAPDGPLCPRTFREARWAYEQGLVDVDEFRSYLGLPPRRRGRFGWARLWGAR